MLPVNGAISNTPNPFNLHPATQPANSSATSFDEQLVAAVSESLRRVGIRNGEVSITVRPEAGGAGSGRQILITYNAAATPIAPPTQSVSTVEEMSWSPWDGPRDKRDGMPAGGGRVTATGAPDIRLNATPTANQYNYTGRAAFNPYFTNPSNPLRKGYVLGYENWFRDATVYGGINGPVPANRIFFTTEEGAQEALRLIREYEPRAELTDMPWGGGPYSASSNMYYIKLPGDRLMNAGLILTGYYNGGCGVTVSSDDALSNAFRNG
jgi:hypothetical protein